MWHFVARQSVAPCCTAGISVAAVADTTHKKADLRRFFYGQSALKFSLNFYNDLILLK